MKLNARKLGLGLVVLGLLIVSVTVVAAREFPRPDLRGGYHEDPPFTMRVCPTCGHGTLWPIKPLLPNEPGFGGVSAQSVSSVLTPSAPQISLGGSSLAARVADPVSLNAAGISKEAGSVDGLFGSFVSSGSDSARVESLENDLRDIIRTLNEQ